jgi:hypothetical protein
MEQLRNGSRSVKIERVFALLMESSLIYCCIWVCPTSRGVLADGFTTLFQGFILDLDVWRHGVG